VRRHLILVVSRQKMAKLIISAVFEEDEKPEQVELELDCNDIGLLNSFICNANRMKKAKIFNAGFPQVRNIRWTATDGFTFVITDFDYSDVCELLHLARPFFLFREPASFEKTLSVFGKKSNSNVMFRYLKSLRELYQRGEYQPFFQFSMEDTPLFHDDTIKRWLNGAEYHQDVVDAAMIAELEKALTQSVTRGIFISQLSGRIKAIFHLSSLVDLVLSNDVVG
jgi:hypothetical protein